MKIVLLVLLISSHAFAQNREDYERPVAKIPRFSLNYSAIGGRGYLGHLHTGGAYNDPLILKRLQDDLKNGETCGSDLQQALATLAANTEIKDMIDDFELTHPGFQTTISIQYTKFASDWEHYSYANYGMGIQVMDRNISPGITLFGLYQQKIRDRKTVCDLIPAEEIKERFESWIKQLLP